MLFVSKDENASAGTYGLPCIVLTPIHDMILVRTSFFSPVTAILDSIMQSESENEEAKMEHANGRVTPAVMRQRSVGLQKSKLQALQTSRQISRTRTTSESSVKDTAETEVATEQ